MRLREVAEGESIKRLTRCRPAATQLKNKYLEIQIQPPKSETKSVFFCRMPKIELYTLKQTQTRFH